MQGELGRGRRFTGAIEPDEEDAGRGIEIERRGIPAEKGGDLVVEDLHDLLAGRDRAQDGFTEGLFLDPGDEILRHGELDVGLEQGEAHFAKGVGDVRLGDLAVTTEFLEGFLKAVGEVGEHRERAASRRKRWKSKR